MSEISQKNCVEFGVNDDVNKLGGCFTRGVCSACIANILQFSSVQKLIITKLIDDLTPTQVGDLFQRMGYSTNDEEMKSFLKSTLLGEFK